MCWAAQAEACDQEQDLLRMGTECAAAVNLLCMAQSQSSLRQCTVGGSPPEATCAEPQVTPVLLYNTCSNHLCDLGALLD